MSFIALALIAITVLGTSFLSGIFGMAGGLILLGVNALILGETWEPPGGWPEEVAA